MGILYNVNAVTLALDLEAVEDYATATEKGSDEIKSPEEFLADAQKGYDNMANGCWRAAVIFLFITLLSIWQFWVNMCPEAKCCHR